VIDLHLHTTASDGRCTPHDLVDRARAAGLTIMAVTDHDTTGAVAEVRAGAAAHGLTAIPGIEITAVEDGWDVHVLGYFLDPADAPLQRFLADQRANRIRRVERIGRRLAERGLRIDIDAILDETRQHSAHAVGRPQVARAMVAAGLVASVQEAFDRWLGRGGPAFVPRDGEPPERVIDIIHASHGLASLAHPGRTRIDGRIRALRDAGLDAIEAYHPDHSPQQVDGYAELASDLGLLLTGGSDFHDDPSRAVRPGTAALPVGEWRRLLAAQGRHG
jgi:hypothetical protein